MTVSSAYIFGKQIKAIDPPAVMFENGQFSNDFVDSNYWNFTNVYGPVAPGTFGDVRTQAMSGYGKYSFNSGSNLVALGTQYQNFYSISNGNIVRSCNTGFSIATCGYTKFIPLQNLTKEYDTIQVEYRIDDGNVLTQLAIGAHIINGEAYQAAGMKYVYTTGSWQTLELKLNQKTLIKALEILTTYGSFQIRKIVFA